MGGWGTLLEKLNSLLGQSGSGNGSFRISASLAVLVVGLIALEIIFRFVRRRIQVALGKR